MAFPNIYSELRLDLSTARNKELFYVYADNFIVEKVDDECYIQLERTDAPKLDLRIYRKISTKPYHVEKIYISNPASSGYLILKVGREASFDVDINTELLAEISEGIRNVLKPSASLLCKEVSVGTTPAQVDTDTMIRDRVTFLADEGNTDTVKIGTSDSQLFPLKAGASLTLAKVRLSDIYVVSATAGQTIYVICGGGWS